MCFSATASFTASALLLGMGALTLRRVERRGDWALALIPVLFAIQQATEGAVWLSLEGRAPGLQFVATQLYSVFSHVLWPIYVPWAVWLAQAPGPRRRTIASFGFAGLVVGLYLLYGMFAYPIVASATGQHIDYESPHFYVAGVLVLYLAATTISPMLSSHAWVRCFGVLALLGAVAAYVAYAQWFISVWCFFAAVLSAVIHLHVRARSSRVDGQGLLVVRHDIP
jgi:hypothetical protein